MLAVDAICAEDIYAYSLLLGLPVFAVKEEACAAGEWMKEGRFLPPVDFWHGPRKQWMILPFNAWMLFV